MRVMVSLPCQTLHAFTRRLSQSNKRAKIRAAQLITHEPTHLLPGGSGLCVSKSIAQVCQPRSEMLSK